MSERENYAEPSPAPAWERPAVRRRAYTWGIIGLLIAAAFLAFVAFCITVRDGNYTTHQTLHRARNLAEACGNYHQHYKTYPAKLTDLLEQRGDVGPFYDSPDGKVMDGWGHPFRYVLVPNEAGELEPYVWSERTRNGKTTLHGAKVAADGTVVLFGLPED